MLSKRPLRSRVHSFGLLAAGLLMAVIGVQLLGVDSDHPALWFIRGLSLGLLIAMWVADE